VTAWRLSPRGHRDRGAHRAKLRPGEAELGLHRLLLAHWHKYTGADEPEIADVIAAGYPQAVERIARATRAPDTRAAAALLFEGILQPGFDPARGARRHAGT
jgi:hypothetical protein